MVKYTLFILLLFCSELLNGQSDNLLDIDIIGPSDGLTETTNYFCYHDSRGQLWISSLAGLYRFDGDEVKRFHSKSSGILGPNVNGHFFEDSAYRLWFTSTEAIHGYNPKTDSLSYFRIPESGHSGYYSFGMDKADLLWYALNDSIYTLNTKTEIHQFRAITRPGSQRFKPFMNKKGKIQKIISYDLIGSNSGLLVQEFHEDTITHQFEPFDGRLGDTIYPRDVAFINDDQVAVGSKRGLYIYDFKQDHILFYSPDSNKLDQHFNSLARIDESELYIGTYSGNLYRFNLSNRTFSKAIILTHNQKKISTPVQALYGDSDGGLWISLPTKGLGYYNVQTHYFQFYSHQLKSRQFNSGSGINPNCFIELDNGKMWVGSNTHGALIMSGLEKIDTHFHRDNSDMPINISRSSFQDTKHRIWVAELTKSYVMDTNGMVLMMSNGNSDSFISICESKSGEIFLGFGHQGGLHRAVTVDGEIEFIRIEKIDVMRKYTSLYTLGNGNILGSYNYTNISVFDPEDDCKEDINLLLGNRVECIWEQGDSLIWMGTDNGILLLDMEKISIRKLDWTSCVKDLNVYGIIPIGDTVLWLSTNNGIYNLDLINKTCTAYTQSYGLYEAQFNLNAYAKRSNGDIWLGSPSGITVFNPKDIHDVDFSSPINLSEILINNMDVQSLNYSISNAQNILSSNALRLKYHDNTISFKFASLDYRGINFAQYEYRLLPEDAHWVSSSNRGFARFANLSSGTHEFQVRNTRELSSNEGPIKKITINIIPPLYKRGWFILLTGLVLALVSYRLNILYHRRKQKIIQLQFEKKLALEQERLRIAVDLHDDLGSSLSALSLRAKFIAEKISGQTDTGISLNQLVENANRLTHKIRETIWTINSKNDTLDNLITRIHQFSMEYFDLSDINCEVTLPLKEMDLPIDGSHRRNIYLVCKEALHNIVKHAQAKNVSIHMSFPRGEKMKILISDDGIGFDTDSVKKSSGTGLESMNERMNDIGGRIEIAKGEQGTQITLQYPLS